MRFLTILFLFSSMTTFAQLSKEKKVIRFLALGDSYTIGESVSEAARWPVQLVDSLRKHGVKIEAPRIIATTGWRTDDLSSAIAHADLKNDYTLVSLLIGVNNEYQKKPVDAYPAEFRGLLKKAIELAGGKKENVFVVSIPDYGFTPYGKERQAEISASLDRYNKINKDIAAEFHVKYFDITGMTREGLNHPDYVAGDGLHPSGIMYTKWVTLMLKELL